MQSIQDQSRTKERTRRQPPQACPHCQRPTCWEAPKGWVCQLPRLNLLQKLAAVHQDEKQQGKLFS
jgi:hypothetical protein